VTVIRGHADGVDKDVVKVGVAGQAEGGYIIGESTAAVQGKLRVPSESSDVVVLGTTLTSGGTIVETENNAVAGGGVTDTMGSCDSVCSTDEGRAASVRSR